MAIREHRRFFLHLEWDFSTRDDLANIRKSRRDRLARKLKDAGEDSDRVDAAVDAAESMRTPDRGKELLSTNVLLELFPHC